MKTLATLVFLAATLAGTSVAQMFTPACPMLKPITDLPPLGHPNATQQCVCETMNRGCHWAWVDKSDTTGQDTNGTHPYVNLADQALRDRIAAQRREKELREERQLIEEQTDHVNDMEIIKAVHDGVLVPLEPGEQTSLPTIRNSSGQEFRVVPPASGPTSAHPGESSQFTHGFFNGRKWMTMSGAERASYVSDYLHEYVRSCLRTSKTAPRPPCTTSQDSPGVAILTCTTGFDVKEHEKACEAKLGDPAHVNPDSPGEIVDGVSALYAAPENLDLSIVVAIKAASMKASGEPQDGIDKYLQTERSAVAGPSKL